jgi:hypothetical protein
MANLGSYYINGPTLATATAVYTDEELIYCAPDGFYSDGSVVRQQLNCELLPAENCDVCAYPCPITPAVSSPVPPSLGAYYMDVDLGSGTGAVIINFTPGGPPNGIKAEYNGNTYNDLISPVDGFHSASGTTAITYLGRTADDCGIAGTSPVLDNYRYNGAAFVAPGGNTNPTIDATDVSLSAAVPGTCVMVIPKLNPTPSTLSLTMIAPCAASQFSIEVECPAALPSFLGAVPEVTGTCGSPLDQTYYHAPVNGTAGLPGLFDMVFSDANGDLPLLGYNSIYLGNLIGPGAGSGRWIEVVQGVIISINNC